MYILGLNCHLHNASVSLVKDGQLIAAAEEERFSRIKYDGNFPMQSLNFCLEKEKISLKEIHHIGFYWRPWLGIPRRIFIALRYLPHTLSFLGPHQIPRGTVRIWKSHLAIASVLKNLGYRNKFYFIPHHLAHAASTFLVSPFEEAAILSVDLAGEIHSTYFGKGEGNQISELSTIKYPHSLGILYAAITQYLGFQPNADEYQVMGLASYGKPRYYDKFKQIVILLPHGGFKLDLDYFIHHWGGDRWYSKKFEELFGPAYVKGEDILKQRFVDIAASCQKILEESIFHILRHLYKKTKCENLTMAGGVALNSTMNGKILENTPFKRLYIQPASFDAGTSLGSALYIYNVLLNRNRSFQMEHAYWGPEFASSQYQMALQSSGLSFRYEENIIGESARFLSQGKIIGWFQGRMEWGPRALGNRSILADPRKKEMKDILNKRVKFRASFRPFAPAVLEENANEYFEMKTDISPFMLLVYRVKPSKRAMIPAVVHIDGTARVQTVNRQTNPFFWELLKEFQKITGIPVLLNTSFNLKGEPIVCTPEDAILSFKRSNMDYLVLGNFIAWKK